MGFKKIVGITQEETAELNRKFVEDITKLYHTFSNKDINRKLDSNMRMLALGGRYLIVASMRESDINWNTLCNYMVVEVTFNDTEDSDNNRVATLLIEDDGGYDNESWKKLRAIMNGDISPEFNLPHGILIRTQGTDFFYSEDEYDDYELSSKGNYLQLVKNNKVVKYFNLNYVVTIDLDYQPEVNDYAELEEGW